MKLLTPFFLLISLPAFGDSSELLPARWLPAGVYGGNQAAVAVEARSVQLDLPCAIGRIDGRPALDEHGEFTAEGTYGTRLAVEPERIGYAATFQGHLVGSSLWIEVTVHGNGVEQAFRYGPLEFGERANFFRCL